VANGTPTELRALSVRQPWAWAILHGGKDVENRTWSTSYRGPLLIHASQTLDRDAASFLSRFGVEPDNYGPGCLATGAIVGRVELVDCVQNADSPWAQPDCWHWILADPEPFETPVPCKGMLGLWTPPPFEAAA
jgi:hypothetical protein